LAGIERRRLRQDRAEAASGAPRPPEQQQAERDQHRRLDVEEYADRIDAPVDHPHVDAPEKQEADELRQRDAEPRRRAGRGERWHEHGEDLVDRVAADPRLDAEPAARNEGAHQRRDVGAHRAE
jgi:hypothetical protein